MVIPARIALTSSRCKREILLLNDGTKCTRLDSNQHNPLYQSGPLAIWIRVRMHPDGIEPSLPPYKSSFLPLEEECIVDLKRFERLVSPLQKENVTVDTTGP